MKLLKFSASFLFGVLLISCSSNKTENLQTTQTDSLSVSNKVDAIEINQNNFIGEYLIGDGGTFIVPVEGTYEMRNSKGEKSDVLYYQGKENDTLSVYANKDKSVIFKMNPSHKMGMYYEPDEQWPVSYLGPNKFEETEEQESGRVLQQRHVEDSIAFTQLGMYDGDYLIYTESEGVNATLKLLYNGDQTFNYEWNFVVANENINCEAKKKGILAMDRTKHGFDRQGDCQIHFNFNGYWEGSYVVEIDFENQEKCLNLKGNCVFTGKYLKK